MGDSTPVEMNIVRSKNNIEVQLINRNGEHYDSHNIKLAKSVKQEHLPDHSVLVIAKVMTDSGEDQIRVNSVKLALTSGFGSMKTWR